MITTAEMRARLLEHSKRASPAPWYVVPEDGGLFSVARADQAVSQWLARHVRYDNAVLIAESANMVPDLLADLEVMGKALDMANKVIADLTIGGE